MTAQGTDLVPAEADILARVGDLPVDFGALAVASNIWRAAQALRTHIERTVLRAEDLSWAGFSALFNLWISGPLETRELAASMSCARATITGIADTLQRRGLVTRSGDPHDRRLVRLDLTDAGRERVESLFPRFNAGEATVVRGLTDDERTTLAALLRRVVLTAQEES